MKIHLIGIGGIGLSALAQYYLSQKNIVSGSDLSCSEIVSFLEKKKIKVFIGKHKTSNLSSETDLVVYSPAIEKNNPELKKALKLGIETKTYPQALGDITRKFSTIAVSGTHGKSTTSSMIALVLVDAGKDPTVIIGTKLKEFNNSNFRKGKSNLLVIEADEYKRSFLNYNPEILVLTNIEKDHLDYYQGLDDILDAFKEYSNRVSGLIISNQEDKNIAKVLKNKLNVKKYSIKQKEALKLKKILKVPGEHNVYNALATLECARALGIKDKETFQTLSRFQGSWRRFQVFPIKQKVLISDYGHHPTEITKTLQATREKYPDRKIRCFFQPHQYERTFFLKDEFVRALRNAPVDELIVSEIYDVAGRENKDIKKRISSKKICELVNKKSVKYEKSLIDAEEYIEKTIALKEVLIVMGAGDIYSSFLRIKESLTKK
jgi:UDP-N-acetylmuramate--alanine ligase